jgi:hypothetical protein
MAEWSLKKLLESLHDDIHQRLETSRKVFVHPVSKGDASENVWLTFLQTYLPQRYQAEKAFVVDSKGNFSDQMDVVVFDRQYSPFIFNYEGEKIVPAEAVYAVFECKQSLNAQFIEYAQKKVESVKNLYRTSLPIPHAGGTYPPKKPIDIYCGILSFESDWNPALGDALENALKQNNGCLNIGCIAAHGYFIFEQSSKTYQLVPGGKPAASFLFQLISALQFSGTVPMIDVLAYMQWIAKVELV